MVRTEGTWARCLVHQSLTDGGGTDGTQVALGQVAPRLQNQILQGGSGAAGLVRRTGAIGPSNAIEPLAFGTLDPVGDRGDTDAKAASDGTQGLTAADSGYHVATPLFLTLCLLMELPHERSGLEQL